MAVSSLTATIHDPTRIVILIETTNTSGRSGILTLRGSLPGPFGKYFFLQDSATSASSQYQNVVLVSLRLGSLLNKVVRRSQKFTPISSITVPFASTVRLQMTWSHLGPPPVVPEKNNAPRSLFSQLLTQGGRQPGADPPVAGATAHIAGHATTTRLASG